MDKDEKPKNFREELDALEILLEKALQDETALSASKLAIRNLLSQNPAAAEPVKLLVDQCLAAEKLDLRSHSLLHESITELMRVGAASLSSTSSDIFGETTVISASQGAGDFTSRAQVGSLLRDRFILRQVVAEGFLGTVFKAQDRHLADEGGKPTWVAVKIIQPQVAQNAAAVRILQQEAAKSRYLLHRNIVRFVDLDREDDVLFTVAEWINGDTLANKLAERRGEPLSIGESLAILRPLAAALDYAHRCGVIHGDIKPETVMIAPDGKPMLFDFGLARLRHLYNRPGRTQQGTALNSYASMQVLTGDTPEVRDDVFSFACLFYRLVAGHRVFGPRNAAQAAEEGMQAEKPPAVTSNTWDTLSEALSFARVPRPASISELMAAIELQSSDTITVAPDATTPSPEGEDNEETLRAPGAPDAAKGGSKRGLAWAAVALVAAVVVVGWLGPWNSKLQPAEPMPVGDFAETDTEQPAAESVRQPLTSDNGAAELLSELPKPIVDDPPGVVQVENSAEVEEEESVAAEEAPDTPPGTAAEQTAEEAVNESFVAMSSPTEVVEMAPADLIIPIERNPESGVSLVLTLREDQRAVVIEVTRNHDILESLSLQLEEVSFSGNRSPFQDGQYLLLNDGRVDFEPGQTRRRLQIVMRNDTARESDRRAVLALVDRTAPDRVYGTISVTLEDDDQRRFEQGLPPDTIAFAAAQVASREQLPAVQVEVVRLNPSTGEFATSFGFVDQTATEGDDYFVPTQKKIIFQPGQRSTRLFIPLVQDSEVEGDETFLLELEGPAGQSMPGVNQRVLVLIRDDDEPPPDQVDVEPDS